MQPTIVLVSNHIHFWRPVIDLISKELNDAGYSVLSVIGPKAPIDESSPEFLRRTDSLYSICTDLPVQGYIVMSGTRTFQ